MDSLRKVFAYRLKELRGDETQAQFAERLDLSLRTYQELESGNIPQRKTIAKIVERLNLASETALFLDPDLIEKAPRPSPEEALDVLAELIRKPAVPIETQRGLTVPADPLLARIQRVLPDGRDQLEAVIEGLERGLRYREQERNLSQDRDRLTKKKA